MIELIAIFLCELSGNTARPWAEAGYTCYCVDVQHSIRRPKIQKVGLGQIIYQWGDVRSWVPPVRIPIAFVAAFPPCTHLAVSGARDFKTKGIPMLFDGLSLFNCCVQVASWSGAPYAVENPIGVIGSHYTHADEMFDPCDYAGYLADPAPEAYTKKTCLWTGGGFVMPPKKRVEPTLGSKMHLLPPSKDRANLRSATPKGFARALFESNAPHLREMSNA